MREILFRARWRDTNIIIQDFSLEYTIDSCNDEKIIVEQFTGLKDKNGKEIYEGDILSCGKKASLYKNLPIEIIGIVFFYQGKYEVETKKVINKYFSNQSSIFFGVQPMDWIHLPEFHKSEIIGNIHENPELLK